MLPGLSAVAALYKSFKTAFMDAFAGGQTQWEKVATEIPSETEGNLYPFLSIWPSFRKWVGDRVIKRLSVSGYYLKNDDYESTLGVPVNAVKDDTYGIFRPMFAMQGDAAARLPDELVFGALAAGASSLCYDGQNFFDTDHPVVVDGVETTASNYDSTGGNNLWVIMDTRRPMKPLLLQKREAVSFINKNAADDDNVFMRKEYLFGGQGRFAAGYGFWQMAYGSLNTLNSTNVKAAIAAMRALKDNNGVPMGINPNVLVCGPSNEAAATAMLKTMLGSGGASNDLYNRLEIIVSDYLT